MLTVDIGLDCGHTLRFRSGQSPVLGDEHWCSTCNRSRTVTAAPPDYHIDCRDCRFSAHYGAAHQRAGIDMDNHARLNPTHTVDLYNGNTVTRTHDAVIHVQTNPPELPPF